MFTKLFWSRAIERALKTAAQAAAALVGANAFDVFSADWQAIAGVSAGAALLSVLTSIASNDFGPEDSPSLVD